MSLAPYRRKRDFRHTPEPEGAAAPPSRRPIFVVHKHVASHLHYDLRLELDGVLKSWAVPKGPSLDPRVRRLAVQVEDHPFDYKDFEGTIPDGNYGAGEVIVWDAGTYEVSGGEQTARRDLERGRMTFVLRGQKLKGAYSLFRFVGERQWLLVKRKDKYASDKDPTADMRSVRSYTALTDDGHWLASGSRRAKKPLTPSSSR